LGAVRSSRPLVLNEAAKSGSQLKPPAPPGRYLLDNNLVPRISLKD
jgi:hypothetical protein